MTLTPDSDMEGWMRRTSKRGAYQDRRGNPFGRIEVLESAVDVLESLVKGRNLIINGKGRHNQRAAASGTSLASGAYFLDRWRSTAATNAVTWTGDQYAGRVLTVPATKSIATTLERANVQAGVHTLSDPGSTAQGRVYNVGASVPAFAALPLNVTLDGTADVVVERGPGTVIATQLERGSTATAYEEVNFGLELLRCQRYFYRLNLVTNQRIAYGFLIATTAAEFDIVLPVDMRSVPSVTISSGSLVWTDGATYNLAVSGISVYFGTPTRVLDLLAYCAAGTQYRPGALATTVATATLDFGSEF